MANDISFNLWSTEVETVQSQADSAGKERAGGVLPTELQVFWTFLKCLRSANLCITRIHSVVLNQELYQNLEEISLNAHVQALADLLNQNFSEEPKIVILLSASGDCDAPTQF